MSELDVLADPASWGELDRALEGWLPRQRWFQGKARVVTGVHVADAAVLGEGGATAVLDLLVEVSYVAGAPERYHVPVVAAHEADLATIGSAGGLLLRDASADAGGCLTLAEALVRPRLRSSVRGATVSGRPVGEAPGGRLAGRVRRMAVEQSNTSVVFDERVILKLFRKLEDGLNPDVEVTAALTEAGFPHVPAQAGSLLLERAGAQTALAVLSTFAVGAREGWALARAEAEGVRDAAHGDRSAPEVVTGGLAGQIFELGAVVARLHVALRQVFGQAPATERAVRSWVDAMQRHARGVLKLAAAKAPGRVADVLAAEDRILGRFEAVVDLDDHGPLVRTHGDLHLGQVLLDPRAGWQILDFEGEPARPLAERRLPHSPLRDAAGMLRSFDYAAAHAALDLPPPLQAWRDRLRTAFLDGYRDTAVPAGLLPASPTDANSLLAAFELDKAVYELGYELANRPEWVSIPTRGILRLLDPAAARYGGTD